MGHTLRDYAYPKIGELSVAAITTEHVLAVLEQPVKGGGAGATPWTAKNVTAGRVRQRIEAILDWAAARGYRSGENPARLRGHLDKILPKLKGRTVKHHAALPYKELPAFIATVRARGGFAAAALEFLILTATRTNETLGAKFEEIDLAERIWTVPASRTKTNKAHRVPLSGRCIAIIEEMQMLRMGDHIFPGRGGRLPLSDNALSMLLQSLRQGITVHGIRSGFRDWCAEQTKHAQYCR